VVRSAIPSRIRGEVEVVAEIDHDEPLELDPDPKVYLA
jgi:hypothetical protein